MPFSYSNTYSVSDAFSDAFAHPNPHANAESDPNTYTKLSGWLGAVDRGIGPRGNNLRRRHRQRAYRNRQL